MLTSLERLAQIKLLNNWVVVKEAEEDAVTVKGTFEVGALSITFIIGALLKQPLQ